MTRDLLGRISLVLSIFCCLGACNFGSQQMEGDLNANVSRLGELLQEYSKIPEKKRELKEGEYGEHRFVVWKDQAQIKSFYEQYRDEMRRIDRTFLAVSENKSAWSD